MWMPGALIGGLLAYQIYSDVWAIGAVVGAVAGLILGRTLAKPPGEQRLAVVEARLAEEHDRIDWLSRRLAELKGSDRATPTTAAAPEIVTAAPAAPRSARRSAATPACAHPVAVRAPPGTAAREPAPRAGRTRRRAAARAGVAARRMAPLAVGHRW